MSRGRESTGHRPQDALGDERQCQMPEHPPAASLASQTRPAAKGCGCRSSVPRASNTMAAGRRATLQRPPAGSAGDRRSNRPTRRRDRDFPLACEQPPVPRHTSAHICPAAGAACGAGHAGTPLGKAHMGKGCRSLTFHIQRCLDRSANPCAFASLCHACRWSGGQHPLHYGRDIRHSWCLTLSPSGTFSP